MRFFCVEVGLTFTRGRPQIIHARRRGSLRQRKGGRPVLRVPPPFRRPLQHHGQRQSPAHRSAPHRRAACVRRCHFRRRDDTGTRPSSQSLTMTHEWELFCACSLIALFTPSIRHDFLDGAKTNIKKNKSQAKLSPAAFTKRGAVKHFGVCGQPDVLGLLTSPLDLLSWACISHPCALCSRCSISCG